MPSPTRQLEQDARREPLLAARRAVRTSDAAADVARAKAAIRDLAAPAPIRPMQTVVLALGCAAAGAAFVRSRTFRRRALRLAWSGLAVGARYASRRLLAARAGLN